MAQNLDGYLLHWYAALREEHGIVLLSDDRKSLAQYLYRARARANEPELAGLAVVMSPVVENELWIVKTAPEASDEPQEK